MLAMLLLCDLGDSEQALKSHNNTNKLTDQGSGRPAVSISARLHLSKESGGFEVSIDG